MLRRLSLIALVSASALTLAIPVDAARGGGKGGGKGGGGSTSESSIVLDQAAPITHGQEITMTVSTMATDRPFSEVECRQNGVLVYTSSAGHFDDYIEWFGPPTHTLSSLSWPSGDADCTAALTYQSRNGRWRTAASTSFHVDG